MVFAVPAAHLVAVVIGIAMTVVVFFVGSIVTPAMIVVAIFFVVTLAVVLRNCQSG